MFNWIVSDTYKYLELFKFVEETKLFEIELFICIKMDLALNKPTMVDMQ